MRSEGATTRPAASSGGDPTYRWSQASDERLARLLDQRRDQLRMLRHLLDDAADAEDVLQQCYIPTPESLGTLRGQERLTAWFDRVVRNAAWVGFAATAPRRARWPCCRERCPRRARSLLEPIRPVDARHSYSGSFPRRMRTCSGACTSGKSRSRSSLAGC